MPFQGENPFSLKGDTQQNITKIFVLWRYHHPDEWKLFPHLASFLFFFSPFCFPTLLHSSPHSGFGRIYLLLPAASPSDKLEAVFKAGLRSSSSHSSTACCLPVNSDVNAGSYNFQTCVIPTAVCEAQTCKLSFAVFSP